MQTKTIDRTLMIGMGLFFFALEIFISYFVGPFSDESFPVATSLRFVQGQTPFIDDLSPYISLGLLLYPVVKLSLWIHQGNHELILFLRHAYLAFLFLTSTYTFFLIRKKIPFFLSFFIISGICLFHPFGINNFHYDTLATLLWSNILFQFYSFQFVGKLKKSHLIIFSLLNLLLCFTYPTFIFFLLCFYLVFLQFTDYSKKVFLSHVLTASAATLGIAWIVFYHFGITLQNLQDFFNFFQSHSLSSNQRIFDKLIKLVQQVTLKYSFGLIIASSVLLAAHYVRKKPFILISCFFFVLLMPFLKINIQQATYVDAFYVLNYLGMLCFPLFLIFLRTDSNAKQLLLFIALPSLGAGILTSLTSYNLDLNFIIGFFPAVLLSFVFIFLILNTQLSSKHSPILTGDTVAYFMSRTILLLGLVILAFFQWNHIYGSNTAGIAMYRNSQRIDIQGPFHGLYVTPAHYALIKELQNDIHRLDIPLAKQFVYFGQFSAGYLFANHLKPGDCFLYDYQQEHFGKPIKTPSYVFDFSKFWQTAPGAIEKYLNGANYQKIATREFYDLYASKHTLYFNQ